ncbi:hypothetical protein GEV33_002973 [Tenebrio molitor]|uniref:Uncharacterized protein n=1 Tax=Tenebrio molitor TaxID=7067 RepID=A0A8J6LI74_TENMO|nr:hypothetical protein GEV33_002973 [Tenebrio molitor]
MWSTWQRNQVGKLESGCLSASPDQICHGFWLTSSAALPTNKQSGRSVCLSGRGLMAATINAKRSLNAIAIDSPKDSSIRPRLPKDRYRSD